MITLILAAILLSQPLMPRWEARRYATVVTTEAARHRLDSFDIVALVHHESGWRSSATNHLGCVGFGQICPPCPGGSCAAFLDGAANLRMVAKAFQLNRDFCRRKVGTSEFRYYIQSYGGFNRPSRNQYCGHRLVKGKWRPQPLPRMIADIMNYKQRLVRKR